MITHVVSMLLIPAAETKNNRLVTVKHVSHGCLMGFEKSSGRLSFFGGTWHAVHFVGPLSTWGIYTLISGPLVAFHTLGPFHFMLV
jgi:hypothetical protein